MYVVGNGISAFRDDLVTGERGHVKFCWGVGATWLAHITDAPSHNQGLARDKKGGPSHLLSHKSGRILLLKYTLLCALILRDGGLYAACHGSFTERAKLRLERRGGSVVTRSLEGHPWKPNANSAGSVSDMSRLRAASAFYEKQPAKHGPAKSQRAVGML